MCGAERAATCLVHERAPGFALAAGALATLVASVATHPIKRYRSRLQMSDDATAASGGELSWRAACARCAWFDGLGITLVHTVLSNALMYVFKEQLTVYAMRVMDAR